MSPGRIHGEAKRYFGTPFRAAQRPDRTACCAPGWGKVVVARWSSVVEGTREAGSALEMWRLEAPVRDKPGIDQHQRRALRPELRDIGNDIMKRSAAGRLCVTERRLNRSGR